MVPQVQISTTTELTEISQELAENALLVSFGGGVGDFGANLTAFRFQETVFWIDSGIGFASHKTPGANRLLPNEEILKRFSPRYVIFTHAHEDHIGAVPYLYHYFEKGVTFFVSPYTHSALLSKFAENEQDHNKFNFVVINHNQEQKIEGIIFHFFFLPHSIPQAFGVGIQLPDKKNTRLFYSGDFKLNGEEKRFSAEDLKKFAPVDYFFSDSTGALSANESEAEKDILPNLEEIIRDWEGRVFITTFSSHTHRVRSIFELAKKYSRPVGTLGYSIKNHLRSAFASKEFDIPVEHLRDPSPKNKRALWLVAGCQGDYGSSLYRLVRDQFSHLQLKKNDLLVFSASMIPGNDKAIYETLNLAAEKGVRILGVHGDDPLLHVSGHGKMKEIGTLLKWLEPACVIPIHGDALHFQAFERIVEKENLSADLKILPASDVHIFTKHKITTHEKINQNFLWVDGMEIHTDVSLFDKRLELSESGICNLLLDQKTHRLVALNYIGTVSSNKMQELQNILFGKATEIIEQVFPPNTDSSNNMEENSKTEKQEKKLKEKIYKMNYSFLKKTPYVNLIWV